MDSFPFGFGGPAPVVHAPTDVKARQAPKAGSKRYGVLKALLERGSLNRFDAEKSPINDHVLNSTISELCRDFDLEIPRVWETVPGHLGKPTEVCRYQLSEADKVKVKALLAKSGEVVDYQSLVYALGSATASSGDAA